MVRSLTNVDDQALAYGLPKSTVPKLVTVSSELAKLSSRLDVRGGCSPTSDLTEKSEGLASEMNWERGERTVISQNAVICNSKSLKFALKNFVVSSLQKIATGESRLADGLEQRVKRCYRSNVTSSFRARPTSIFICKKHGFAHVKRPSSRRYVESGCETLYFAIRS